MTIREAVQNAARRLEEAGVPDPRIAGSAKQMPIKGVKTYSCA